MECCFVDDTLPENMIVGLPPGWVDTDVSRLYIGINPPQPGGRPRGLLQSLGGWSNALMARWWPCLESECATWPKKCSRLVLEILETGEQLVVSLTEALVTCCYTGSEGFFGETMCQRHPVAKQEPLWSSTHPNHTSTAGRHTLDTTWHVASKHASPAASYNSADG